jgi:hypothetical protein
VAKTGITVTAVRTKDRSRDKNKVRGQKINIGPKDFEPRNMLIQCELLTTNTSDEMQRMNVFSQAVQIGLPISKAEIAERMGWGASDVLVQDWLKEKMQEIALASFQKMEDLKIQIMAQQATLAQSASAGVQPPQPPPGGQGVPPPDQMGGAQMMPGGDANNPNGGGMPPAMSSPQETQTQTQRPGPS